MLPSHDPTCPPRLFPRLQPDNDAVAEVAANQQGPRLLLESMTAVLENGRGVPEQPASAACLDVRTVSSELAKLDKLYRPVEVMRAHRKSLRFLHMPVVFCSDAR